MSDPPPRLRSFLEELKRRHVFRVAFYYGAGAFGVLQAADIVFPVLGVPEWGFRLMVVASLLGFPVALLLAWLYDLTPEGLIRTRAAGIEDVRSASVRLAARTAFGLVSVLLVLGVLWLSYRWSGEADAPGSLGDAKSVAVLPFEALPATEEARFLAEGLHEDLLGQLSKIGELRVISRTSVQQYRDTDKNVRQIAGELGVGSVVEGSVRRAGGRVRVTAQLIDARTDDHLWSETYQRDEDDVFQIQSEIAQQIATALQAELTQEERDRIAEAPRASIDAYDAYNRGRVHFDRREGRDDALAAVESFRRAVELDPEFAPAWASLARAHMWLFWNWPGYGDRAELAGEALDRAEALAPDAVETHLARGYLHYYGRGDYDRALEHFRAARRIRPSEAEAVAAEALIRRRQGRWEDAVRGLRDAQNQDPRSYNLAFALGETLLRMRRFAEAEQAFDRAIDLAPDLLGAYDRKLRARLGAAADTAWARGWLAELEGELSRRDLAPLRAELARYRGESSAAVGLLRGDRPDAHLEIARAARVAGLDSVALAHARQAQRAAQALLEPDSDAPGAVQAGILATAHATLGIARAILGERAGAIREGSYATALLPLSSDAFAGAEQVVSMAIIYALVGEHDAALDRIQTALSVPAPLTWTDLRLDPVFESLRDHPRFLELEAPVSGSRGTAAP